MAKAVNAADEESADLPRGPVEARSLSAITGIASNPPAYPRNPTQKKLEPLSLYIVRVPGSKDVFLSPLKPPTKASVSAEAINASLYYLHVATPDDQALLHEVEQEREEKARLRREMGDDADLPPELARLNNVRRKPVPGGGGGHNGDAEKKEAPSTPPSLPVRPPMHSPSHSTASLQPPPMPARPGLSPRSSGDFAGAPQHRQDFLDNPTDDPTSARPRRPLPPVPQDEDALDAYEENFMKKPHRWSALGHLSRGQEFWKEKYEALSAAGRHSLDSREPRMRPTSAHASPSYPHMGSPGRSPGQSPTRRPQEGRPPERPGFHITLIRRDPTHGSQWNVATMSMPRMDGGAIDIEVFTPGYKRFAAQNEPLSLTSLGVNLPAEARNSLNLPPQSEAAETTSNEPAQPRRFQRKLCVSRPHVPEESRGSLDISGARPSIDSLGRPSSQSGGGVSKLKSGYYTFTSPWNGTCTFSTSVNGRSLKCKHMIPMPGFPPAGGGNGAVENPAVTVAEIRFNTPFQASHLPHNPGPSHVSPFYLSQTAGFKDPAAASDSHPDGTSAFLPPGSKRSSLAYFFNAHAQAFTNRPRSRSGASTHSNHNNNYPPPPSTPPFHARKPSHSSASSVDIDDPSGESRRPLRRQPSEDRLDFSLAREPAGGGMRGKSAKLGKLVIEDEGIKMLDLVVASCMAVWWRGYYY